MYEVKIAVISDIHLGNKRNKTTDIIKNLRQAFPDNAETGELDIIFLAGDVFDDLLSFPDDDVTEIQIWVHSFLSVCARRNIMVRVLEGTPSHDWFQSEVFNTVHRISDIPVDLKYVKELSVEYIDRFDMNVLYVPDEWENETEKTLAQATALIKAKGLEQVDLAIMHGSFEYQLPSFVKAQKHDSEAYHRIVKGLIFIGHIHTHSRNNRIIAQGSFDRLAHGEEGAKGHVRANIRSHTDFNIRFVENVGAKKFITVNCVNKSLEETLIYTNEKIRNLPDGSQVRIEADSDNPIFTNMEVLIRQYPLFTFNKHPQDAEKEKDLVIEDATVYIPVTITKGNIVDLLMDRIVSRGVSTITLDAAKTILSEVT